MLGQKKKKDQGFAEALVTVSIRMVFDGPGGDLIKERCNDQDDYDRFMLALALGHAALAKVAINNKLSVDHSRKTQILNHLKETFIYKLSKSSHDFHISKYIIADHEVEMVESEYGNCDFTTDMKMLLIFIYDSRVREYVSAIREGLERVKKGDGSRINPFLKMINTMGKHVYGDDYAKDTVFISKISSMMFAILQSMMSVCEEYK
jgi:hypothetical protein